MELKKYRLGDIAEIIGGVSYSPKDICTGGIRILRGGNIQNQHIELKTDDVFLPISYKNNISQIYVGDTILVASTGSVDVLGKAATCFQYTEDVQIGAFLRIIRPKADKYTMLISSALSSDYFKRYIKAQAKGTSINNITLGYLRDFEIYAPHDFTGLSHLSANIENKICLNRAINDNLEAMAKQLYDYWFVQFDFPNEDGKPYKSSGGAMVWNEKLKREIPQGLDTPKIGDIEKNIITGKTPSCADEDNFGGDIPFVTIDDIRGNLFVFEAQRTLSTKGADSQEKKYLPIGSLSVSCIGTIGVMGFVARLAQTNQQINSIVFEHEYNKEFLYFSLKLYFENAKAKTGNVFANMSKEEFASIIVAYPPKQILQAFHNKVAPIFDSIKNNTEEINSLTKQRDELLPLLMNGQATVNYHLSTQKSFKDSTNLSSISPIFSQKSE